MPRTDGHWWMKFVGKDWLTDKELSKCRPATRGIWIDWCCHMEAGETYKLRGTPAQLSQLGRCSDSEAGDAVEDLRRTKTANVYEHDGAFTVISRRLKREHRERVMARARQKRYEEKKENGKPTENQRKPDGGLTRQSKNKSKSNKQKQRTSGKKPPDPRVKIFIDWFYQRYQVMFGREYIVSGGKDGTLVKGLLKKMSLEDLQLATDRMFADDFGVQAGATIGVLAAQINKWRGEPSPDKGMSQKRIDAAAKEGWGE